jgi:putative spermidine/putrescine transport system permease protein
MKFLTASFWTRLLLIIWCGFSYIFLLSPIVVVIGASFHGGNYETALRFPPENLTLNWYFKIPEAQLKSLGLSFTIATLSTLCACIIGIPAALGLVRSQLKLKSIIFALFRAPLQIPAIVSGIAFLQVYYFVGELVGINLYGSLLGLTIGHIFIATPLVVGSVVAVLYRFDTTLEEAALIHGANRLRTLWRITLPVIMPGTYAGALYAFMISFGDVPLSIFLTATGFNTYPVEIFFAMENDYNPGMFASGSLVIYLCLILLLIAQRFAGLDTLLKTGRSGR